MATPLPPLPARPASWRPRPRRKRRRPANGAGTAPTTTDSPDRADHDPWLTDPVPGNNERHGSGGFRRRRTVAGLVLRRGGSIAVPGRLRRLGHLARHAGRRRPAG